MIHTWAGIIKSLSLHWKLGQEVTTFVREAVKSCFNGEHKTNQQEQIFMCFSKTQCCTQGGRVYMWMQLYSEIIWKETKEECTRVPKHLYAPWLLLAPGLGGKACSA